MWAESAEFVWTKAHRYVEGLDGLDLLLAQGNDAADPLARACVHLRARSQLEMVSGFRVAPQGSHVIFPGLSFLCFGLLTVAVCHPLRSTAGGCVWVLMRMPFVRFRRRTRFFVRGVGGFRLSFALVT